MPEAAARFIDRPDAPNRVSSDRTTERSSSNSVDSRWNKLSSGALVRRVETMQNSEGQIRATGMVEEICDEPGVFSSPCSNVGPAITDMPSALP
jgi:hypothetical protein